MRKKLRNSFWLMVVGLWLITLAACQTNEKREDDHGHEMHEHDHSMHSEEKEAYTCPMPEDSVFSDKPGSCPKCGMDLIKVEKKDMAASYQCPMYCDSLTFNKPGICPVCKMDLEKVGETSAHTKHTKVFTCPMHPEIIRNEQGQCPICGMDLVEKLESTGGKKLGLGAILEPVNKTVLASLKTVRPEEQSLESKVEASGYITYNPQNSYGIAVRYAGRVEKLYVKYNFQLVQKGQKIMDIYSPELVTAQENFVFLLTNDIDNSPLIASAKQQLRLLGMSEGQLVQLEKTKKAERVVSVYSPKSGHVHEMQSTSDLTMPNMQMNSAAKGGMASNNQTQSEFSIREGMYVNKSQTLFSIISTDKLWAILKVFPEDVPNVKLHQSVELYSEMHPDKIHKGLIDFLEPSYDPQSKHLTARVYLDHGNHNDLKIGSLVKGTIKASSQKGIWIPKQAVLDLGNFNQVVFLKSGEAFTIKKVVVGNRIGDKVEIRDGLNKQDEIAYDAQYLIDSEGFIQQTP